MYFKVFSVSRFQIIIMKKDKNSEIYSFKAVSSSNQSQKSLKESRDVDSSKHKQQEPVNYNFQKQPKQNVNKLKTGLYRHEANKGFRHLAALKNEMCYKEAEYNQNIAQNIANTLLVHPKIASLDQEIQQNIKRRIQLESDLNRLKQIQKNNEQVQDLLLNNNFIGSPYLNQESNLRIQKEFGLRNLQTELINQTIMNKKQNFSFVKQPNNRQKVCSNSHFFRQKQRQKIINQNIQILTDSNLEAIVRKGFSANISKQQQKKKQITNDFYDLESFLVLDKNGQTSKSKNHQSKSYLKQPDLSIPPPIIVIQQLLSRLTFPEIPRQNIEKLFQTCSKLYATYSSHSDLVYLMMVSNFHLSNYHNVRKYFKEILMFKKFDLKAYWIAAQTEYCLNNFQRCIKLVDHCMEHLNDRFLPRFLYLQAKSYYEIGNFTNSIVCYNQLIRVKPKISEYYLERAVLYDKLGYEEECKEDYLMFGILKPEAKSYLQQKILIEQNEPRRKELLQIYKKMI